jgi:hypothetical protein
MNPPRMRPYGTWTSPITAAQIASGAVGLSEVQLHDGDIYWLEMRPTEGGRGSGTLPSSASYFGRFPFSGT